MKPMYLAAGILAAGLIAALLVRSSLWTSIPLQEVSPSIALPDSGPTSQGAPSQSRLETPSDEALRSAEAASEIAPPQAQSTSGVPGEQPLTEEEQQWMKKWGELSVGKLETARIEFSLELARLSMPAYDEYEMRGDYEVVAVGGSYTEKNWNEKPMIAIRMKSSDAQDRRVLKITLRESEYPELYALHREHLWLKHRVKELRKIALR